MTNGNNKYSTDAEVTRRRVLSGGIVVGLSSIAGCIGGDDGENIPTETSTDTETEALPPDPNLTQLESSEVPEETKMVVYKEELDQEVPNTYNKALQERRSAILGLKFGERIYRIDEDYKKARERFNGVERCADEALSFYDSAQSVAEENGWDNIVDAISQAKAEMKKYKSAAVELQEAMGLELEGGDETGNPEASPTRRNGFALYREGKEIDIIGIERIRAWVDEHTE